MLCYVMLCYVMLYGEMFSVVMILTCDLSRVSSTRVHGPSSRAELTARELGCIFGHHTAELTAGVDGCQKTHPSSLAVNSGS